MAARDSSWEDFVDESMRVGLDAIRRHTLLDEELADNIAIVVERRAGRRDHAQHRLVWGDINFGNVLVAANDSVSGLIDFEGCLSGDPLATLGYGFAVHGTQPFYALVLQAWPQLLTQADQDTIARYALLRALRLARYAHLPLPTGRPRDRLLEIFPGVVPALKRLTRRH
jgi:aminoglycoside phosphotransferase (APT) family kinase protein